jgi:chemotaxis receptor (MCP) glutamine deamidase CheD
MAMVCAAELPSTLGWDVRILATDLDTDVLAEAKSAIYDEAELNDVPPALRKRFSVRQGKALRVHPECVSLVTFAQANLVADPFPVRGAFDATFCRNVMIYFDRPTQDRLVRELTQRLQPHGYFVVGHSESLLGQQLERVLDVVGVYRAPATSIPQNAAPRPAAATARAAGRGVPNLPIKRIVLGQWHSSGAPMLISTLLGSCVSACLHDPVAKLGGMNHFMLPRDVGNDDNPARFGVHAMELLINELMEKGAQRARLQAHAFGAAAVNKNLTSSVAAENGMFIKHFLAREGIPLVSERLGGSLPREVMLNTENGDCFVRTISHSQADLMEKQEVAAYEAGTPLTSLRPPAPFNVDDALF